MSAAIPLEDLESIVLMPGDRVILARENPRTIKRIVIQERTKLVDVPKDGEAIAKVAMYRGVCGWDILDFTSRPVLSRWKSPVE